MNDNAAIDRNDLLFVLFYLVFAAISRAALAAQFSCVCPSSRLKESSHSGATLEVLEELSASEMAAG